MRGLSFLFIFCFFIYRQRKQDWCFLTKVLFSILLASPAFNGTSVLFIIELHFIALSILLEFLVSYFYKRDRIFSIAERKRNIE